MSFAGLEPLFEAEGLPAFALPERLRRLYGGDLGFDREVVYANFVSTVDGVVALEGVMDSPGLISGSSRADRFVVGLLRACADAVLVGAGTVRAARAHRWTPDFVFPDLGRFYAELRSILSLAAEPHLVIVTRGGGLDPHEPALRHGATVITTQRALPRVRSSLPSADVVGLGDGDRLDVAVVVDFLRRRGFRRILSEAGPDLFGQLLARRLAQQLFLTVSPLMAGRDGDVRPGLIGGTRFLPAIRREVRLLSLKRHRSHLFLRYRVES